MCKIEEEKLCRFEIFYELTSFPCDDYAVSTSVLLIVLTFVTFFEALCLLTQVSKFTVRFTKKSFTSGHKVLFSQRIKRIKRVKPIKMSMLTMNSDYAVVGHKLRSPSSESTKSSDDESPLKMFDSSDICALYKALFTVRGLHGDEV